MDDTNVVVLVGRLTSNPELRTPPSGTSFCSMRLAFNTNIKSPSGEWEDKGNFINLTVWGKQGENCARLLHKGSRIAVNARLDWREWGEQGSKRSEISLVANRVQFLDPKGEGQARPTAQAAPQVTDDTSEVPF